MVFLKKKEIKKNLKQYSENYKRLDDVYQQQTSKELLEKRRKMMEDFTLFRRTSAKRVAEQKLKRIELRDGVDTEQTLSKEEEIEYSVQFLVENKREEIPE